MSFAKIYTRGLLGLHAPLIEVEVHVSQGLPSLTIVGLPEAAVRESKDRVRSAIINSGFLFPTKRLTINLAPADLPKDGSRLDLPIALGILMASGQIAEHSTDGLEFIGELALDGQLRPVSGILSIAMACQQAAHQLVVPAQNAEHACQLPNFQVFAAQHLKQVCEHLSQQQIIQPYTAAGFVTVSAALVMGIIGAVVCFWAITVLKNRLKVDDSLDAFGLHGVGGIVGAILTAFFASDFIMGDKAPVNMLHQLWVQIEGVLATVAYSAVMTFIILKVIDLVMGIRVVADDERMGLDLSQHGERIE